MSDNIEDRSEIPSDAKEIVTTNEIEATDSEHTTNVDNELRQDESMNKQEMTQMTTLHPNVN